MKTNKGNILIISIVAVAILIGGGVYAYSLRNTSMMQKEGSMMNTDKAMVDDKNMMKVDATGTTMKDGEKMMEKDKDMTNAGSYENYSSEKIAKAATGSVVLFFRASWCPTCKAVDTDIKANLDKIPANFTILDVNYDDSTSLKKKYGVTYQHTFVQVDKNGNIIKKWSGSPTLSALVAEVK